MVYRHSRCRTGRTLSMTRHVRSRQPVAPSGDDAAAPREISNNLQGFFHRRGVGATQDNEDMVMPRRSRFARNPGKVRCVLAETSLCPDANLDFQWATVPHVRERW